MFSQVVLSNWGEFSEVLNLINGFVYRGQRDASWGLSTRIERDAGTSHLPLPQLPPLETTLRRTFKRRAHHYLASPPEKHEELEWLALMQHHGSPTRLLDFTHSPYVAAHFAFRGAVHNSAVWAFNRMRFFLKDESNKDINEAQVKQVELAEQTLSSPNPSPGIFIVEPERLEERLAAQQGCFLCPGVVSQTFEENLTHHLTLSGPFADHFVPQTKDGLIHSDPYELDVIKFVFSEDLRANALVDLQQMGISEATLFPGLDGFARHLADVLAVAGLAYNKIQH